MLYITYKDNSEVTWYVGSAKLPATHNTRPCSWDGYPSRSVKTIQADGDELEYILDRFTNIPHNVKKRVHVWTGDIARTIVANL